MTFTAPLGAFDNSPHALAAGVMQRIEASPVGTTEKQIGFNNKQISAVPTGLKMFIHRFPPLKRAGYCRKVPTGQKQFQRKVT